MTEPKLIELFDGVHAHRDALIRQAGDAAEDSTAVADGAKEAAAIASLLSDFSVSLARARHGLYADTVRKIAQRATRLSMSLTAPAERQAARARELGAALEALVRLADGVQDDTVPGIDLSAVAATDDD